MQLLLFPNKVLALSYENFLKKQSRCCPCLTSLMLKGLFITGVIDFPFTFLPCRNETEQSCCCCLVGQGFGDRCTQQSKVLQGHSQPQQLCNGQAQDHKWTTDKDTENTQCQFLKMKPPVYRVSDNSKPVEHTGTEKKTWSR